MRKIELFIYVLFVVLPLALLLFFSIELAMEKYDESQIIANVTTSKDEIVIGKGRNIYYEYIFSLDNKTYIGADFKSFCNSALAEGRQFANQTRLQVYFCKSDPKRNGFDENICQNIGWAFGIVIVATCTVACWCNCLFNGGTEFFTEVFKRKKTKQTDKSSSTPGQV